MCCLWFWFIGIVCGNSVVVCFVVFFCVCCGLVCGFFGCWCWGVGVGIWLVCCCLWVVVCVCVWFSVGGLLWFCLCCVVCWVWYVVWLFCCWLVSVLCGWCIGVGGVCFCDWWFGVFCVWCLWDFWVLVCVWVCFLVGWWVFGWVFVVCVFCVLIGICWGDCSYCCCYWWYVWLVGFGFCVLWVVLYCGVDILSLFVFGFGFCYDCGICNILIMWVFVCYWILRWW